MLTNSLTRIYIKVLSVQAVFAIVLSLVALPFGVSLSVSALVGGTSVLFGSIAYLAVATCGGKKKRLGGAILGRHLLAEVLKIVVTTGLLGAALASAQFDALALVVAATLVIVGHGFAFLIIR